MKSFISLLTDLGETYAGIMQGVIYSINPQFR
jgi:S-adenosylmethionine hydrolase